MTSVRFKKTREKPFWDTGWLAGQKPTSGWAILKDGVEIGIITGRQGNWSHSPTWTIYGDSPEARNHLKGRSTFSTLREAKAAIVARLSAPPPTPCACGEPTMRDSKGADLPHCLSCRRKGLTREAHCV